MAVDRWTVTFGTAKRGLGGAAARPGHQPAHQRPMYQSLYCCVMVRPLLCGVKVPIIKELTWKLNESLVMTELVNE